MQQLPHGFRCETVIAYKTRNNYTILVWKPYDN